MNCHSTVGQDKEWVLALKQYWERGEPIPWVKVHDLPDFVYFDHSIHVAKGVGCETCHGPVNEMPLLYRGATLQMQWCLDCHRNPEPHLRPLDRVTDMAWTAEDPDAL